MLFAITFQSVAQTVSFIIDAPLEILHIEHEEETNDKEPAEQTLKDEILQHTNSLSFNFETALAQLISVFYTHHYLNFTIEIHSPPPELS